jgi:hypothetical protein
MLTMRFPKRSSVSPRPDHSFRPRLEILEERVNPQAFDVVGMGAGGFGIPQPFLNGAFGINTVGSNQTHSFVSSSLIGLYNLYTEGGLPGEPQNAYFLAAEVNGTSAGVSGGGALGPSPGQLAQLQQMVMGLYALAAQQNLQQTNNLVIDEAFLGLETFTYLQGQFLGTSTNPSVLADSGVHTILINQNAVYQTPVGHLLGEAVFDYMLGTQLLNHPNAI